MRRAGSKGSRSQPRRGNGGRRNPRRGGSNSLSGGGRGRRRCGGGCRGTRSKVLNAESCCEATIDLVLNSLLHIEATGQTLVILLQDLRLGRHKSPSETANIRQRQILSILRFFGEMLVVDAELVVEVLRTVDFLDNTGFTSHMLETQEISKEDLLVVQILGGDSVKSLLKNVENLAPAVNAFGLVTDTL
jgi:hypothetical protein